MTAEETIVPEDEEEEVVEAPEAPETSGVPEVPERRVGPVGSVLVVGSGIAGMQASLDLADTNILVHLVEDKAGIGGWMSKLDKTFPTNDCAMCTMAPRLVQIGRHKDIEIITLADVQSI
ncbi:MAG: FAD-dependent oxidoreductase, partial [Thermoplasmata archaeon]|nr:FAD-dependent oxidoreductase [Thermoplasmata archaeon]